MSALYQIALYKAFDPLPGDQGRRRGPVEVVLDIGDAEGTGEQEPLPALAVGALKSGQLSSILDPLGEGLEAKGLAELDESGDQGGAFRGCGHLGDEGPIDLEGVHGELLQV